MRRTCSSRSGAVSIIAAFSGIAFGLVVRSSHGSAEELPYKSLAETVVSSSETILGETITYPTGSPAKITAVIVTVPPGGETGWHTHPVPLFGYILQGVLTVDYGQKGVRMYRTGDGLLEAMATAHNGRNAGDVPVRILAVYIGMGGIPNAEAASGHHNPPARPR